MIIKTKKYRIKLVSVSSLLFLKPIIDIFYQIRFLDIIILFFALLLLLNQITKKYLEKNKVDVFILLLLIMYSAILLKDYSYYSLNTYIKIVSAYILYFIGRLATENIDVCLEFFKLGSEIAMGINVIALLLGKGMKTWGTAQTLTGLYAFKTDMAVALITLIIILITERKKNVKDVSILIVALLLLIMTNSRISILVGLAIFALGFLYYKEMKSKGKYILKINIKLVLLIFLVAITSIYILRFLGKTSLFSKMGFISLNFNKLNDLFSDSNTQGRNHIWIQIMSDFEKHGFVDKLFGISIDNNIAAIMNATNVSAHNLYLAIIYGIGFCGIVVTILFMFGILKKLNSTKNRRLFYVALMYICMFLVFGISVNTNEFTNYSWPFMLFIGMLFNHNVDSVNNGESMNTWRMSYKK